MRRPATATAETVALHDGELVLERYRLERRLGAGGFGAVWQARDTKLERDVAVKVIPRDGSGDERADREARAAARLNHPGIVGLYELGADEGDFYLVSELVPGRTLAELAKARALSDRDVARIGSALCEALEHAHGRGVIHRDVKPQNVMVLAEPAAGAGFAKLADFGVAHLASGDPLTRTGDVVGTLAYMAPEQAEGERVSPACDVYSLALTLYEAWTGTNPVRAAGPAATARRLGRPLPPLASKRRDLPLELCEAIDLALHPEPEARPAPARLRAALRRVEGELSDKGGLVEPETLERFGLTAVRRAPALPLPAAVAARLGAGLAAGGLGLAALEQLGPEPSVLPAGRRRGGRRCWWPCSRASAGSRPRSRSAAGSPRPRRDARAPRWCWPPAWPPSRSFCRARASCGRSRRWRRCSARSRWRPPSSRLRRSRPARYAAPGLPRRASSGSRSARCSSPPTCCSACRTARSRARPGRAR